jgi:hypothetical protein
MPRLLARNSSPTLGEGIKARKAVKLILPALPPMMACTRIEIPAYRDVKAIPTKG